MAGATEVVTSWDDVGPVIHQELDRLPERYRAPILLCCLEGLTREQAAGRLGWPMGTLQSRLARGREKLKVRLIKRGVAPVAAIAEAIVAQEGTRAAVPEFLIEATVRAAARFATVQATTTGVFSVAVTKISEGVLKTMVLHKLKTLAGAMLAIGLISTGVAGWAKQKPDAGSTGEREPSIPDAAIVTTTTERDSTPVTGVPERGGPTDGGADFESDPSLGEPAEVESAASLKYNDDAPDGKKSLGGSGEMIEFTGPSDTNNVKGIRIHGARYGYPEAPKESFLIFFLSPDQKRILHTAMGPTRSSTGGPRNGSRSASSRRSSFRRSSGWWSIFAHIRPRECTSALIQAPAAIILVLACQEFPRARCDLVGIG